MSFTGDMRLWTTKGAIRFKELDKLGDSSIEIVQDNRGKHDNVDVCEATGVIKTSDSASVVRVHTSNGFYIDITPDTKIPVVRDEYDNRDKVHIKTIVYLPIRDIPIGEEIMIYSLQAKSNKTLNFNTGTLNNCLSLITGMVNVRPDRFIRTEFVNNKYTRHLILDTIRDISKFTKIDIRYYRRFSSAVSRLINLLELPLMKHLHWLSYNSHLGDILYELDWLQGELEKHSNFNINNLAAPESWDNLYTSSSNTNRNLLNFLCSFTTVVLGKGKKSMFNIIHKEKYVLENIQQILLKFGVFSRLDSILFSDCRNAGWYKEHCGSYFQQCLMEQVGSKKPLTMNLLEFDPVSLEEALFATNSSNGKDYLAELRNVRLTKALKRAKNLHSHRNFWTAIVKKEVIENQPVWDILNPSNNHKLVVNGFLIHD